MSDGLFDFAVLTAGTLVDADIIRFANSGRLIVESFDPSRVKQACYELRAGDVFYETGSGREDTRVAVAVDGTYILRPQSYVTVITMESLDLPGNVLARVLTKGQLFSVGLLPVNTYADPGFRGRLGITLCNVSRRYLKISPGQPIAKLEFTVLPKAVERPYYGQHGYDTGIWPIPTHLFASPADLQAHGIKPHSDAELSASYGREFAQLTRRLQYYERRVWLQLFTTIAVFLGALGWFGRMDWVSAIALGVAGNLLTQLIFWIGADRR